jgi:hypothetical protein
MPQMMAKARKIKKKGGNNGPLVVIAFIVAGFMLILLAGWLINANREKGPSGYVPEVTGGPSLRVDRDLIDFGDVQFNQAVTATVQLINVGDMPLKILRDPYIEVKEGC